MNLGDVRVGRRVGHKQYLLVNLPHAGNTLVVREVITSLLRAAVEVAEVLIQVCQEPAVFQSLAVDLETWLKITHYWLDVVVLEGFLASRAVAPPSSRKLTTVGLPPLFVEA